MGLKHFDTNLSFISKEKTLRYDVDFLSFQNKVSIQDYYSFNDLFEIQINNAVNIDSIEGNFLYSEIGNVSKNGDIEPITLNLNERNIEDQDLYKKIEKGDIISPKERDILISKVRPNLKKFIYINDENKNYFYTSAFINLKPKKLNKILYYSFKTIFYNNLIAIARQGKGYPTLNEKDFLNLKFNKKIIDTLINKEKSILSKIDPIEKEIKKLKSKIIPSYQIINDIFSEEFNFDKNLYYKFGKGMTAGTQKSKSKELKTFNIDLKSISSSETLRFSTRFHNTTTKKLMKVLNNIDTIDVKDVVYEHDKGIQPTYKENGEIPVIKIANLKNSFIDMSEMEQISIEDFENIEEIKKLKNNDIILCVTGKCSLGKLDIYESNEKMITTIDNFILRLTKEYNILFFTYFFRSILGIFQIERDYIGTTNQIHLYWDEIKKFKIPNISLSEQQRIVNKIKKELDKQELINNQIQEKRNEIDKIIEESIQK